jgi:hypothetical protein
MSLVKIGASRAIRNRALILVAAAVLAGLGAVINWPSGMSAEVVGGVVFLVGTVLGVEWFIEQENQRDRERRLRERWAGLGGVPFRGLSGPVGDIVDALAWLLTGDHPFDRPHDVSETRMGTLHSAFRQTGLKPTNIPSEGQQLLFEERLGVLLANAEWCKLAGKVIDQVKWRYRGQIGVWAGPMLDYADVAEVLRRMTLLDDCIGELQAPLRELGGLPHERPGDPGQARKRWFFLLAECVSLREDLQRAAIVGEASFEAATRKLEGFARHRHWTLPPDRALLDGRADWTAAPLSSDDVAGWRQRREHVLATPLADTPADWSIGRTDTLSGDR